LTTSLGVVRAYLQNLQFRQTLPNEIEVPFTIQYARSMPERGVSEWALEILAKEIILNSPDQGETELLKWNEFSGALNKLKDLENRLGGRHKNIVAPNILVELYRIAHRQFHWQVRPNTTTLARYYRLFNRPDMDALLRREMGLSAKKLYTIGLMLAGAYLDQFGITYPIPVDVPDITQEQFDAFISRFACEIADMRETIRSHQSYDQDYAYTFNPLKAHPLLWLTLRGRRTLVAPIPTYLLRRFTEGIFYDLYDSPGFSAAFGAAFQQCVGDAAQAANIAGRLKILDERRYRVGKNDKNSIDWIISDDTGHLFVECKTKRPTVRAKMAIASTEALDEELGKMASFVVQTYKALVDAQAGHYPHWKPDGNPTHPIVVTLEDWLAFGDRILLEIDRQVRSGLAARGIDAAICDQHPFSICSVAEFEKVIQVIEQVGIAKAMAERFASERRGWLLSLAIQDAFPAEYSKLRVDLFPDALSEIGGPL
jgi:hypothetical protein